MCISLELAAGFLKMFDLYESMRDQIKNPIDFATFSFVFGYILYIPYDESCSNRVDYLSSRMYQSKYTTKKSGSMHR